MPNTTHIPKVSPASDCSVTWRYVLQVLRSLEDSDNAHLLDTAVHISCEPTDTEPEEMKRYQGTPDTFTPLMDGSAAVGFVMCYLGSPNDKILPTASK